MVVANAMRVVSFYIFDIAKRLGETSHKLSWPRPWKFVNFCKPQFYFVFFLFAWAKALRRRTWTVNIFDSKAAQSYHICNFCCCSFCCRLIYFYNIFFAVFLKLSFRSPYKFFIRLLFDDFVFCTICVPMFLSLLLLRTCHHSHIVFFCTVFLLFLVTKCKIASQIELHAHFSSRKTQ